MYAICLLQFDFEQKYRFAHSISASACLKIQSILLAIRFDLLRKFIFFVKFKNQRL